MNGRADGLRKLDLTIDGFWRSFGAIVLILPVAVIAMVSERAILPAIGGEVAALTGGYVLAWLIAVTIDWLAFPVILALLAQPMGIATRFVPFIVARNWAAVLVNAIIAAPHLLHALGALPTGAMPFVQMILFGIVIWFAYIVVRTAMQVPPVLAVPIVILEIACGFVIGLAFTQLAIG